MAWWIESRDTWSWSPAGRTYVLRGWSASIPLRPQGALTLETCAQALAARDLLAGLRRPQRGEVLVDGLPLLELDANELAAWRLYGTGVVGGESPCDPAERVTSWLERPLRLARWRRPRRRLRFSQLLGAIEPPITERDQIGSLSPSQWVAAKAARAHALDPALILHGPWPPEIGARGRVAGVARRLGARGNRLELCTADG